jgi:biopolymer transport protein ExbB/TolQ
MVSGQIVAMVVLLVLVLGCVLAWWLFRRHNTAQRQIDATRHREEAASRTASADRLEVEAAERAARAQREQAQAEELAEMARRDRELAQSQIAKADRLDPDGARPVGPTPVEPSAPTLSRRDRDGHGEVEVTDPPAAEGLKSKIK